MGLLNKILEARYDDNQVLINSKGDYKPVAELFVTTNKVVFTHFEFRISRLLVKCIFYVQNQIDTRVVEERCSDRIMVIPWSAMEVSDPHTLQAKANEYTAFISQEMKPTEYTIGEMGDYLRRLIKKNLSFSEFSS